MLSLDKFIEKALETDALDKENEDELLNDINVIYDELFDDIIDIILSFYGEYGEDVTWNELHKNIKADKIVQTSKRMERLKKLKDNTDIKEVKAKLQEEIGILRGRGVITGDKFLSDRLNEEMINATTKVTAKVDKLLKDTFIREYTELVGKPPKNVDKLISIPHYGKNWLDRFFDNKNKILSSIKVEILKGITQGTSPRKVIKKVQELGNMTKSQAETLVRTENAFARMEGILEGYENSGRIEEVVFIAVGDKITCPSCRDRDGTVVPLKDLRVEDVILHPRCRCTIAPNVK